MTICTSVKILQFSDKPNGAGGYSQAHRRSIAVADPFWHSCRGIQISPTQVLESSRPQSIPKICLNMGIYPQVMFCFKPWNHNKACVFVCVFSFAGMVLEFRCLTKILTGNHGFDRQIWVLTVNILLKTRILLQIHGHLNRKTWDSEALYLWDLRGTVYSDIAAQIDECSLRLNASQTYGINQNLNCRVNQYKTNFFWMEHPKKRNG